MECAIFANVNKKQKTIKPQDPEGHQDYDTRNLRRAGKDKETQPRPL